VSYSKLIKELSQKVDELQKQIEELSTQVSANSKDVTETSSSLIELNKKIEKINNDLLDTLKKIENLSQEISALKRENIEIKEKIDTSITSQPTVEPQEYKEETKTSSKEIEFDDYKVLNKKIEEIKKELQDIKETQKLQIATDIKDPNLRRIVTSPYFTLTIFFISIFALIAAF
ncbi:MAG: hypothetical protein QXO21_01785, partial [Candidatus Anstonellales archaeon]